MADQRVPLLEVRNLKKHFDKSKGFFFKDKKILTAVDGINFHIYKGETFGLVGESGCGKTTTGRTIIKLHNPTDGEIFFYGERIGAGNDSLKEELKAAKSAGETDKVEEIKEELKQRKKDNLNVDSVLMKKMQMIFFRLIERFR